MPVRAESNSKFLRRFLLIAAVLLGYGLYSLYDAVLTGPKHMKKANEFWVAGEEGGEDVWKKRHSGEAWQEIVKKNNWPIGEPKTPTSATGFTYFNYFMAVVCIPLGLLALMKYLKTNNTWIEATSTALESSWGTKFSFDEIKSIDKKKWAQKGIARIAYGQAGHESFFVLDDFKYDRGPADEILYMMEQKLSDDQILNGDRELSPAEVAKAKRLAALEKAKLENLDEE